MGLLRLPNSYRQRLYKKKIALFRELLILTCQCSLILIILAWQQCPSNGGLNDVTRIQTATASYTICTGCLGNEVVSTDVKYCTNSYISPQNTLSCRSPFGPCSGATIYR